MYKKRAFSSETSSPWQGSLDGTVLVFVIATVLHLFLWICTWLFLTVKMAWKFKLRVTVGRAAVHNAKSIKLVNDIDLHHQGWKFMSCIVIVKGWFNMQAGSRLATQH